MKRAYQQLHGEGDQNQFQLGQDDCLQGAHLGLKGEESNPEGWGGGEGEGEGL